MQSSAIAFVLFATLVAVECLTPINIVSENGPFPPPTARQDKPNTEDNSITQGGDNSNQTPQESSDCGDGETDEFYPPEGEDFAEERQFNDFDASDDFPLYDYELSDGVVDSLNYDGDYFGPASDGGGFSDYSVRGDSGAFDSAAYDYDYAGDGGFDPDYGSPSFRSSIGSIHGQKKK